MANPGVGDELGSPPALASPLEASVEDHGPLAPIGQSAEVDALCISVAPELVSDAETTHCPDEDEVGR